MRSPEERSTLRKRGVAFASLGYAMALTVLLALKLLGAVHFDFTSYLIAVVTTVAGQLVLWLIPHLGWDVRFEFDPHYVYVPLLTGAGLFTVYMLVVPDARLLILMFSFVAFLFTAGYAGLFDVIRIGAAIALGYLAVMAFHRAVGHSLSLAFEATVAGAYLLVVTYTGLVLERLRRRRLQMLELRSKLAEEARSDPLTGLPNRRYFEEVLSAELARIRRYGGACSVGLLDVDHFKRFNDTQGHPAGDRALQELAAVIRKQVRNTDVPFRYGGEEFGVVMVNTPGKEALIALERLRRAVAEHAFPGRDALPENRLTISAGMASAPADAADFGTLVQMADNALYAAKRGGRNRVMAALAA